MPKQRRPRNPHRKNPAATTADPKRGLHEAKLKGLLRSVLDDELELVDAPGAAGGIVASASADSSGEASTGSADPPRGFLLLSNDLGTSTQIRGIGRALIWADKTGVGELNVLAEPGSAPDLARRALYFENTPKIWEIRGTQLVAAKPRPLPTVPDLSLSELEFAPTMSDGGTRPVDDHGRLVGEIAGLEVARVTVDESGAFLEVGVGQADRELQQLVHGGLDRIEALERAVGMVLEHRRRNAPLHPLNRLARERWLRSEILDDPSLINLRSVEPLAPLRPRSTLLGTEPCAAIGTSADDETVVVVCSVGVDADLAAEAAEYRHREAPDARLILVVPEKDQHPAVVRTVDRLDRSSLCTIPLPWGIPT